MQSHSTVTRPLTDCFGRSVSPSEVGFRTWPLEILENVARGSCDDRARRAAGSFHLYQWVGPKGLLRSPEGREYRATGLCIWSSLRNRDGVSRPTWSGCSCPDARNLEPLNQELERRRAYVRVRCKHEYIRDLLAGHTLRVGNAAVRAAAHLVVPERVSAAGSGWE